MKKPNLLSQNRYVMLLVIGMVSISKYFLESATIPPNWMDLLGILQIVFFCLYGLAAVVVVFIFPVGSMMKEKKWWEQKSEPLSLMDRFMDGWAKLFIALLPVVFWGLFVLLAIHYGWARFIIYCTIISAAVFLQPKEKAGE